MLIFLTGGTGFIGQHLAKALRRRGWNVTALVRNPDSPQAQSLSNIGVRLAVGDITVRESMRAAMLGADIVVHNAGQYEYGMDVAGIQRMRKVNIDGTENVLDLACELGVMRTIYISTVQAFGETGKLPRDETYIRQFPCRTVYEQSKTDAHQIALQYQQQGLPLIIVCPHQVIGPNDHSVFGYLQRLYINHALPPLAWSPDTILCCVGVNDLAEGIALAVEDGCIGETYFLSGEPQTLSELFDSWGKLPGGFIPRIWLPAGIAAALFALTEPLQRMAGLPAFLSRETVRAGATNWCVTNEKAKQELGWTPCSAEALWSATLSGEIELLSQREGQNLIQRLKPLPVVDLI